MKSRWEGFKGAETVQAAVFLLFPVKLWNEIMEFCKVKWFMYNKSSC